MRGNRLLLILAAVVTGVATTLVAVAINVATGGSSPWFPALEAQPLWWVAGATVAVVGAWLLAWWAQQRVDRRLVDVVPVAQRPESWVVDRPAEVRQVVTALRRKERATVGITTALKGAGGFGKTTVAKMVRADPRVLRRFGGGVYWVTLGRDVRTGAVLAEKVNDLIARLDPQKPRTFTDPRQAGEQLAALLAVGPPRLLVLDDVWYPEQEAAFPVSGRCARLITTRVSSLVKGECVPVRVDQVTLVQARALLTAGLPPLRPALVAELVANTGRWPLLLRLVNKVLADQAKTTRDLTESAKDLVERLRRSGPAQVDLVTGEAWQRLDVGDPEQRQRAVAATIEASRGLLTREERERFAELAIFAEDETVPVRLVGLLWQATGELDLMATRALCARLDDLALLTTASGTGGEGVVSLHDVIRDFLREEVGTRRLTGLHQVLLRTVAASLPAAPTHDTAGSPDGMGTAWWELEDSARYLWDHLIEHLIAAERIKDADALASDLRWVGARLNHSGPLAPYADLALVDTPRCVRLHRLLGQATHLLAPTEPAYCLVDILYSRVAHAPDWEPQVLALTRDSTTPRLANRWPLPDLPNPALRRTLTAHTNALPAVAVAPDGSWLATAGADSTVQIWDVASGIERATLTGHKGAVTAVAVSPDGSWLATAGTDGTVRTFDVMTGAEQATLTRRAGVVNGVAVAADGSWLATAGADGIVRIFDVATRVERATLTRRTGEMRAGVWNKVVNAVAIAPDGSWLAAVGFDGIRILDVATGIRRQNILTGRASGVFVVAVSPDGSWLATAGHSNEVLIWDVATGTSRAILTTRTGVVNAVAIAPDGSWLAAACADGTVRIFDVPIGTIGTEQTERVTLTGHTAEATAVAVSPDGSWLATAGADGTVRIFDVPIATGRTDRATSRSHTGGVNAVAAASDGTWLATASTDNTVRIWDVETGAELVTMSGHTDEVTAVAPAPNGTWLATAGLDGTVRIWRVATGAELATMTTSAGKVNAVAVAPNRAWLATAGRDGTVGIWGVATGDEWATLTGHAGWVTAVAMAPDGSWIATAGRDGTVRIWGVPLGPVGTEWIERDRIGGPLSEVSAVAVGPDGSWLAAGGTDGAVRIWGVAPRAARATLTGHTGGVSAIAVSPDGSWIATASTDRTVRIWNVADGRTHAMMRIERPATTCAWVQNGQSVAVGGPGGLHLFDFHSGVR